MELTQKVTAHSFYICISISVRYVAEFKNKLMGDMVYF
jgi:hypothetical protein